MLHYIFVFDLFLVDLFSYVLTTDAGTGFCEFVSDPFPFSSFGYLKAGSPYGIVDSLFVAFSF